MNSSETSDRIGRLSKQCGRCKRHLGVCTYQSAGWLVVLAQRQDRHLSRRRIPRNVHIMWSGCERCGLGAVVKAQGAPATSAPCKPVPGGVGLSASATNRKHLRALPGRYCNQVVAVQPVLRRPPTRQSRVERRGYATTANGGGGTGRFASIDARVAIHSRSYGTERL